jgi:hypothetical protein
MFFLYTKLSLSKQLMKVNFFRDPMYCTYFVKRMNNMYDTGQYPDAILYFSLLP